MKVGARKLARAGIMPARTWGVHAVGMAPTDRLKLRRQMAAAACKKRSHSVLGRRSLDRQMGGPV